VQARQLASSISELQAEAAEEQTKAAALEKGV
jgi:hypothetical protein